MNATHIFWSNGSEYIRGGTLDGIRELVFGTAPAGDFFNGPLENPELQMCEEMDDDQIRYLETTGDYPAPRTAGVCVLEFCK